MKYTQEKPKLTRGNLNKNHKKTLEPERTPKNNPQKNPNKSTHQRTQTRTKGKTPKDPRYNPQKPPRHTTLHHLGLAFPTPRRSFKVAFPTSFVYFMMIFN
jgi:hypothetical protein